MERIEDHHSLLDRIVDSGVVQFVHVEVEVKALPLRGDFWLKS
jgi:hypothetical protein